MIADRQFEVDAGSGQQRLDRFLVMAVPSSSRALIVEAIAAGDVTVNGRAAAKGLRLETGDAVAVTHLLESRDIRVHPNGTLPLSVVYEGPDLLAFDKPAGVPVHPIHHSERDTLANAMVARHPELQAIGDEPLFPALLHRIDTLTSGLVLAARTDDTYRAVRACFAARTVTKEYIALVEGHPPTGQTLVNALAHNPHRRGRMLVVDEKPGVARGEPRFEAASEIDVEQSFGTHTLVRVTIHTGITHQIRCQLAHAGFPIVGDAVYGAGESDELLPDRHFLHARALHFAHPVTGEQIAIRAALPAELLGVLTTLGQPR